VHIARVVSETGQPQESGWGAWAVSRGRGRERERERRWPQARERRRLAAGEGGRRVQARSDGTSNGQKRLVATRWQRGPVTARGAKGRGAVDGVGVALGISGEGYSSRLRQASPWEAQPTRPRLRLPPSLVLASPAGPTATAAYACQFLRCASAFSARRAVLPCWLCFQ
jgi:hypothetical protein